MNRFDPLDLRGELTMCVLKIWIKLDPANFLKINEITVITHISLFKKYGVGGVTIREGPQLKTIRYI